MEICMFIAGMLLGNVFGWFVIGPALIRIDKAIRKRRQLDGYADNR